MYLTKKIYVGGEHEFNKVIGSVISIVTDGKKISLQPREISEIVCQVGYWRKANAIHKWFVDNIQGGVDDCREYIAEYTKLMELKALCKRVLDTKDSSLLPPQSGFFFGSTEVDEYYWGSLTETIEILEKLNGDEYHCYRSSW